VVNYLSEFIALAVIHFLAVVTPGPDFAVTVSQSVQYGKKVGILTALGIGMGISVHVLYTLAGVGALMHTNDLIFNGAKIAGVIYILYLAIKLFKTSSSAPDKNFDMLATQRSQNAGKAFSTGFFTNATNPKATLFFLAIFTTIVSNKTPVYIQALYGVWMCMVNAAWFMIVAMFFSHKKVRVNFLRFGHWFERTMGMLLCLFALKMLFGASSS
jgi:RhtB (resistance to homoserine/threonine) family protein